MTLRGAIIGFGNIAVNGHLPAYRNHPHIEIPAVVDALPATAELCRNVLPRSAFYSDADALLENEDVDFVDIATPPGTHAGLICQALQHGTHVLCEKPLVLTAGDMQTVAGLAEKTCKTVFTVHNWRYAPLFRKISELVEEKAIGDVRRISYEVIRSRPSVTVGEAEAGTNWRLNPDIAGGGILVDHGWHAFYMVNQWAGSTPRWVQCRLENRRYDRIPVEDTATVEIGYPGASARVFFTWAGSGRRNRVTIEGTQGTITADDDVIGLTRGGEKQRHAFPEALSQGSHHPDWYGFIMDEFVEEMRAGDGRNLEEATWCFSLLDACKKAHLSGARQPLPAATLAGASR